MDFSETMRQAVDRFGVQSQVMMLFEEMSELQNALCKLNRGRDTVDHVCEEIADVMIMCQQMAEIFGREAVTDWIFKKVKRLSRLLNDHSERPHDTADR